MTVGVGLTLDRHLVRFVNELRRAGLDVPPGCTLEFGRAVAEVGATTRSGVYWSGRATLVRRPEDVERFDAIFEHHWTGAPTSGRVPVEHSPVTLVLDTADDSPDSTEEVEDRGDDHLSVRWSRAEVLGSRDFAECTDGELAELHDLMSRLRLFGATRRCRRLRPTSRRGRPDLRRTVREALRTGGEPMR
ncbi:MAG: hypothetical protein VX808_01700, partial [Actinomycetota bacterium]|nr:hypothetical protein [Actinomycetota bacterium]